MATYEISTSGDPGPVRVPAQVSSTGTTGTTGTTETVLVLTVGDATGLESSLGRLADLGFELRSVRRAPGSPRPEHGTARTSRKGPGATWEVCVLGRVGPVLLHAVPHDHVSFHVRQRTVVAETSDRVGLADVLATVLATGARLEWVRARGDVTLGGEPSGRGRAG